MEKGWINIYAANEYQVTIAKDLLEAGEIESVIINHRDSSYVFLGEFELYIREEDENQAALILEQLKTS